MHFGADGAHLGSPACACFAGDMACDVLGQSEFLVTVFEQTLVGIALYFAQYAFVHASCHKMNTTDVQH